MNTQYLLLVYFIFLFCSGCSSDKNTENDNEGFHFYKSILSISYNIREYKFRNTPAEEGYVTSFPWEAIQAKLPKHIIDSVNIQYWIYQSIEDAELAMVERLDLSNLYMNNIIDLPLPQGQIGNNCWHQSSVGVIQFLRNNLFVSVTPNINSSSIDSSDVQWLAREIDLSIMESEKVDNINLIPTPNILSMDIISSLPEDWG